MRAVLNASLVSSIRDACSLLVYKNLHLPVEEDDEFRGDGTPAGGPGLSSTQSLMLQQLQEMNRTMQEQQRQAGPGYVNAVGPTPSRGQGRSLMSGTSDPNAGPLRIPWPLTPELRRAK